MDVTAKQFMIAKSEQRGHGFDPHDLDYDHEYMDQTDIVRRAMLVCWRSSANDDREIEDSVMETFGVEHSVAVQVCDKYIKGTGHGLDYTPEQLVRLAVGRCSSPREVARAFAVDIDTASIIIDQYYIG